MTAAIIRDKLKWIPQVVMLTLPGEAQVNEPADTMPFDETVLQSLPSQLCPSVIERGRAIDRFIEKPIFIAGMGRSGTTLLLRLLDGHHEIFLVPMDDMLFTHFLPAFDKSGDRTKLAQAICGRMHKQIRNRDPLAAARAHITKTLHEANEITPFVVWRTLLQALAIDHPTQGKRVWLAKCPDNEFHLDRMFETFPKARVIFNVRDPRGVYYSYRKGGADHSPEIVGQAWARRLRLMMDFRFRTQFRSRFYLLRYEKYVRDLEEIGKMLDFMGLQRPAREIKPTFLGNPFEGNSWDPATNTPGRIDPDKADAWRSKISAEEADLVAAGAGLELALLGYS